jgi:ankyrin repeat protein
MTRVAGVFAMAFILAAACGVVRADDLSVNEKLLAAVRANDDAGVARALDMGAAVDSRNRIGDTPLISACKKGQAPLARLLIEHGANVSQADVQGVTPLMAAAFGGSQEIVTLLLAHHADLASTDRVGKTAIEYAAGLGNTAIVGQLLDAGVDVNAAYHNHLTALMWAAGYDRVPTVSLLLARGARRDLRDDRGLTAKDIAQQTGSKEVVLVLTGQ